MTLGADGALAAEPGRLGHIPAVPALVMDVTGAGDALVAAVLAALCGGAHLADAVARGCAAAARTVETGSPVGRPEASTP